MELQHPCLFWADGSHMIYFPELISSLFIYTYVPNQKFNLFQHDIQVRNGWKKKGQSNTFLAVLSKQINECRDSTSHC